MKISLDKHWHLATNNYELELAELEFSLLRVAAAFERWRADWNPSFQNTFFYRLFLEPGAFVMERKMLLGIKLRAENIA